MKTKQKAWLACCIIVLGCIGNLFISTALHLLLSGKSVQFEVPSLLFIFESLFSSHSHLLLFICLQGIVILLAVLFFVMNSQPYQSQLRQVAPGIETPVATGQHQHGSARWLQKDEWSQAFDHCTLDLRHPLVQHLLATGYDDLSFMKPSQQGENRDESNSSQDDSEN